eukprot:366473-Chlamydomonas_euryale.AAC.5
MSESVDSASMAAWRSSSRLICTWGGRSVNSVWDLGEDKGSVCGGKDSEGVGPRRGGSKVGRWKEGGRKCNNEGKVEQLAAERIRPKPGEQVSRDKRSKSALLQHKPTGQWREGGQGVRVAQE